MASPNFFPTAPGTPKMRTHDAATSELLRRAVCKAQPHKNDMYFATTTSLSSFFHAESSKLLTCIFKSSSHAPGSKVQDARAILLLRRGREEFGCS